MRDVLLALVLGGVVGFLFGIAKLPVPAPPTAAGVVGVAAITLGWQLAKLFLR